MGTEDSITYLSQKSPFQGSNLTPEYRDFVESKTADFFNNSPSDYHIEVSYKHINDFLERNERYKLDDLIALIDPEIIDIINDYLDTTFGDFIDKDVDDEIFDKLGNILLEGALEEKNSFRKKRVLDVMLIKKILDLKPYWHTNITEGLLNRNFVGCHTEDLFYIWLYTLKLKKI